MEYILAVDLQPEFVKDREGKKVYDKCLDFLKREGSFYTVIAPVYQNKTNPNMGRLLNWREMREITPIEFSPDFAVIHSGYSIKDYPTFARDDIIHVIGFDTDACVLSACFDLFNLGACFDIWTDMCWSSGGKKLHEAGLTIMRRQFGAAVSQSTRR